LFQKISSLHSPSLHSPPPSPLLSPSPGFKIGNISCRYGILDDGGFLILIREREGRGRGGGREGRREGGEEGRRRERQGRVRELIFYSFRGRSLLRR
jgi:hypothetical protein